MNIIKLKGGSLSATYHHVDENIIRKEVSLKTNREYGFVRWYSQLKKLQKYNTIYPDLFPKVLNVSHKDNYAYFDIEYFPDAQEYDNISLFQCISFQFQTKDLQ